MELSGSTVVIVDDKLFTIIKKHIDQKLHYQQYKVHERTVIVEMVDEDTVVCPLLFFNFLYHESVYRIIWRTSLQIDNVVISQVYAPGRELG